MPQHRSPYEFPGIGRCIYCGSPGKSSELTDEHIIARGLGGRRFIADACCNSCQIKIHRFETSALEGFLWPARVHDGVKPRHARRRRTTFETVVRRPSLIIGGEVIGRRVIPVEKHPYIIAMPVYPPPRGGSDDAGPQLHSWSGLAAQPLFLPDFEARVAATRLLYGGDPVLSVDFHHLLFMRMLMKIAHCEVRAAGASIRGSILQHFQSWLGVMVLDENAPVAKYVGGLQTVPPPDEKEGRHRVRFRSMPSDIGEILFVDIQLFYKYGMPIYQVASGLRAYNWPWERDEDNLKLRYFDISTGEEYEAGTTLRAAAKQWRYSS